MRVALDVMGGDFAPQNNILGAKLALEELSELKTLYMVGDEETIKDQLSKNNLSDKRIEIVHASQVVEMSDSSTESVRRKKDSSISNCVDLVKKKEAQAIVSAGHTGAAVAATSVKLRLIPGIDRPALAASLPNDFGNCVLIDVGANVESKPENLFQSAIMGSVYSEYVYKKSNPRVGLLAFGGEESKITKNAKLVYDMLVNSSLNFVGNVEGHDLFEKHIDVVVCDGYAGNIVLKSCEATAKVFAKWLKSEFSQNIMRKINALMLKKAFLNVKDKGNYETYGGSPLLGINGNCIVCHGSSSAIAIKNAIKYSGESIKQEVVPHIKELLEKNNIEKLNDKTVKK